MALEELDSGKNSPAFGRALNDYRAALGSVFEEINVIAIGVHGARFEAYAARADVLFLEDTASELVPLVAAHVLFVRQFDAWLDYVGDASGEPSAEIVEAAIVVARATRNEPEIFADDVSIPIGEFADAAEHPLAANPEDRPPLIVQRELLRSVGNIMSGLFAPLVAYAGDAGSAARKGLLEGIADGTMGFSKMATKAALALAFGGSAYVMALVLGLNGEFGWIKPVLEFLKIKLKL